MAAFDFLASHSMYRSEDRSVARLNRRHDFLIEPFRAEIDGARVLDLGAHDGRWSIAFAQAGAASVLAVEGRAELLDDFNEMPDSPAKARVTLEVDDIFDQLDKLNRAQERFDVIALFGILYHVMDHFRLLRRCVELGPKLILVDSEFMQAKWGFIKLISENTGGDLNATPQIAGQTFAIKGVPSSMALQKMARALNYRVQWLDWESLPPEDRAGVQDYFRGPEEKKIRRSCALRPKGGASEPESEG